MARQFNVPDFYRSSVISTVKEARRVTDPRKKDLSPSLIDFGPIRFRIARHFGFCYGVENAVEIAYRALDENPNKRVFLLSEMIHNPRVNGDLESRGIRFLRTTEGRQLIPFDELTPDDVVIIPAFGSTIEITQELQRYGVDTYAYNTTCPFVEKVWKRSSQIGTKDYTVVIHGKHNHEETRATFSHAEKDAHVVVLLDLFEAELLAAVITGDAEAGAFFDEFDGRHSPGFDPVTHLRRIGVVNQTTMLATETQAIADLLRRAMIRRYGAENIGEHFADTSDTLCYATNENQNATHALIRQPADLAIVVGGHNSSNTSHLVELCSQAMPTYFIQDATEILSRHVISHFDLEQKKQVEIENWLPTHEPVTVVLTAGASCPDSLLDEVVTRLIDWFPGTRSVEEALSPFAEATA
ncbi:MAG: 4-hydroxy-3-methylbut-2-enyl diphosphate reductase [Rhodothermales bacterium]|nr:4-hydroxy-3-methylbut-2-enyl diphosphate reductase [Rhodothermales bacterium]